MNISNTSGTKCPKCENSSFELGADFPSNSKVKMNYIRCATCKTFLHAVPYFDTNLLLVKIQEDIDKIKKR